MAGQAELVGLIENCVGGMFLPVGIAPNFKINGRDYLVPMAVEESSVVAAAAHGAKMCYHTGGFQSRLTDNLMIGQTQFQLYQPDDSKRFTQLLHERSDELLDQLNAAFPSMARRGGGIKSLYVRGPFQYQDHHFVIVQFEADVKDAMGANVINLIAEQLGKAIEGLLPGKSHTCILSNLSTKRLVRTECRIDLTQLTPRMGGADVKRRIELTQGFAEVDPFRAVTHNKGIMNGIDAVLIATGNDWRANSAGAHGYAAMTGRIKPLSHWSVEQGMIHGKLEIPIQVGIVGGVTRIHPVAKLCLDILGVQSGTQLAEVVAAVGLAQNFSAIRALAFEGICQGHMKLHQSNLDRHQQIV
jgi:hydroxymethylglutaryl-CoA reductase